MLMRFAQACDASHATSSQCKAYLGAVVVGLYAGNAAEAWATYQVRHPVPQQEMEETGTKTTKMMLLGNAVKRSLKLFCPACHENTRKTEE